MTFIPMYNKKEFYICCSTAKRYKKELGLCKMKLYKEKEIEQIIMGELKQITKQYIDNKRIAQKIVGAHDCAHNKTKIQILQNKIHETQQISLNLYKDKVKGIVTEKQFLEFMQEINEEKEKYILKIQEENKKLEREEANQKNNEILENVIDRILNFEDVDNSIISLLIQKIIINLDETIEINFNFKESTKTRTNV